MTPDTPSKPFRSAEDEKLLERALELSAQAKARFGVAQQAYAAAEAEAVDNPSTKTFSKAKDARIAQDDAEREFCIADHHAAKVGDEVEARSQDAIRAKLSELSASMTEIVDDESRLDAVEIAAFAVRQHRRTEARVAQRRAELAEINRLRAIVREQPLDVASVEALTLRAVKEHAELGLAAQVLLGVRERDLARQVGAFFLPYWRSGAGGYDPKEFVSGAINGTRSDGDQICAEAAKLLERVEARRSAAVGKKSVSGVAKAVVGALATVAALTLTDG